MSGHYSFNGVHPEQPIRKVNTTFVPVALAGSTLGLAPEQVINAFNLREAKLGTTRVDATVFLTVKIGGVERAWSARACQSIVTNEAGGVVGGYLAVRDIVPGTLVFAHTVFATNVIDNGSGDLVLANSPTTVVGSVDYATGRVGYTTGSALGDVTVAFSYTGYVDVQDTANTSVASTNGAGTAAQTTTLGYPSVPGTISGADATAGPNTITIVDDGRGNLIQTNGASLTLNEVVGTINYKTGAIVVAGLSNNITTSITWTFRRNVFGKTLSAGGARTTIELTPSNGSAWNAAVASPTDLATSGALFPGVLAGFVCEYLVTGSTTPGSVVVEYVASGEDQFYIPNLVKDRSGIREAVYRDGVAY
jgi:hypothetical protein